MCKRLYRFNQTSKTVSTYRTWFRHMKDYFFDQFNIVCNFQSVVCDCEPAIIRAFKYEFPRCDILGCLFHYCQCILRFVQTHGLIREYCNNDTVHTIVRLILSLPFVDITSVPRAYENIREYVGTIVQF